MSNDLAAYGYTEATLAPSLHHCSDNLVDAVIEPPDVILMCYTCRTYWHTGLRQTSAYKSLTTVINEADKRYPKRKRRHMSHAALSQIVELCNITDILGCGGEIKVVFNRHQFTLVQDGPAVVASVDGEQCRFVGITEREIKSELYAWLPGAWR